MPLSNEERGWVKKCSKGIWMADMGLVLWYLKFKTPVNSDHLWINEYLKNAGEVKSLMFARCIKEGWELPVPVPVPIPLTRRW